MQGRLSPAYDGRLQFFPRDWKKEFNVAKEVGFDYIQWYNDLHRNDLDPLSDFWNNEQFLKELDEQLKILPVSSVDIGKYKVVGPEASQSITKFEQIFPGMAPRFFTKVISLPILENNKLKNVEEKKEAVGCIREMGKIAESFGLKIALESDMPADELLVFLHQVGLNNVGVCYDIGNCTSYGFNCPEDLVKLGERIFEVHLKDRKVGTEQSVLLGKGDADFNGCFRVLKKIRYDGVCTMQAWRGKDYLRDARQQLTFIKNMQKKYEI